MRNLIFIVSFFITTNCLTQNNLRLYSSDGSMFKVYADGKLINEKPQADILVQDISADTLTIKVEFENKLTGSAQLYFLEKGIRVTNQEFDYQVELKINKLKFLFTGIYPILKLHDPLVPKPPVIDTSYKLRNNMLGHYCELKEGKILYFNNIPSTGECLIPMPVAYSTYVNMLMKRAQTEDDKYAIAENTCMNNCISATQLSNILFHISYELDKLKLIKTAYFHITDKNNKSYLDSTFKLEASKKELASFLKSTDDYKLNFDIHCVSATNETNMNQLTTKLSVYSNDTERYQVLKKTYTDYCYSVKQVKLILNIFLHDREKLDTAKLLFFYCTEKEKYTDISDVFSYNSTISDLKDFINKQNK